MADEKGYVYRTPSPLTQGDLASLLKDRFADACAIVRRVDGAEMKRCEELLPTLATWTEGQIFNEHAELRWRQTEGKYAVLLLTEQNNPPEGFQPLDGSPFTVVCPSQKEAHGFLLWGTRQRKDSNFLETRIPRPLRYPIQTNGKPPQLVYRLYQEGAAVRWVRLVGFKEVKS